MEKLNSIDLKDLAILIKLQDHIKNLIAQTDKEIHSKELSDFELERKIGFRGGLIVINNYIKDLAKNK